MKKRGEPCDRVDREDADEMTVKRPPITRSMSVAEFTRWYWLKTELVVLCGMLNLSKTGTKLELEENIRRHLSGEIPKPSAKRRRAGAMPGVLTPETVIGPGWRCNPALGAYFRKTVGNGFHFNAAVRQFIHDDGVGQTLADAAVCYTVSTLPGSPKPLIPRQLAYNQHFRDFFSTHPGATREQGIASWWSKRSERDGTRRRVDTREPSVRRPMKGVEVAIDNRDPQD